jgi:hypothetical protein
VKDFQLYTIFPGHTKVTSDLKSNSEEFFCAAAKKSTQLKSLIQLTVQYLNESLASGYVCKRNVPENWFASDIWLFVRNALGQCMESGCEGGDVLTGWESAQGREVDSREL